MRVAMPPAPPPNILLVVADDLPRNILGAYGAQHGLLPELDGLARSGMTFSSAYTVAPLCTPSRYALLTGSYASRGARERIEDGKRNPARQVDFQVFLSHHTRGPPTPTLARLLRGRGYTTGLIGKYHVGHSLQPAECGIAGASGSEHEKFVRASLLANSNQRAEQSCHTIGNQSCMAASIKQHAGFDHVADVYYDNDGLTFYAHQPEWMTHEALRFVRSARRRHKPFFLWMAPSLTHSPADIARQLTSEPRYGPAGCGGEEEPGADGESMAAYKASVRRTRAAVISRLSKAKLLCSRNTSELRICSDERLPPPSTLLKPEPWLPSEWFLDEGSGDAGRRAGLATSVCLATWLDASLAPLFSEIAEKGSEQTLTIFTSDHGPYFAGKGHAYEAGVRVPFIARWINGPADSQIGRTITTRVTHLDLLPTLMAVTSEAAAASNMAELAPSIDGVPIAALARGTHGMLQESPSQSPLFIEVGFSRSVVLNGYKLMLHLLPPSAAADSQCRSIHGIKLPPAVSRSGDGGTAAAKAAKIKFVYDVRERHPVHHCDRVQLYELTSDPAEQHNVASSHPGLVKSMEKLILDHVAAVEVPTAEGKHQGSKGAASSSGSSRTLRGPETEVAQKHKPGGAPRSWCQSCHPSTDCDVWPDEWSFAGAATSPMLDDGIQALIQRHADALVVGMGSNASAHAVARMVRMSRGEPYAPRDKCVLLRAVDGRLLIDWLGTDYAEQHDFTIASCYPSKKGNYLRSRLHIALRLILRALRRMQPLPAFEIGFCPDDCSPALSSSDEGVLPALTSVSCAGRRTLPMVAWTVNSNRAPDLSEWDDFIDEWARKASGVPWQDRQAKAIFRGHLRPFTVTGNWPDAAAPQYNEPINAQNWRTRGRSAIWAGRIAHPELLDVNFDNRAEMASLWKLSAAEAMSVDDPTSISMEEQARRYRYVIHPEGQCGFADRLKSIMALPMLVLKQSNPCEEWYEGLLVAGEHYLPVDGNYANLSSAVSWARAHDAEAQRVATAGHARIRQVVSLRGVYAYVDRLVARYASRYGAASSAIVGNYTHEFSCSLRRVESRRSTECQLKRLNEGL